MKKLPVVREFMSVSLITLRPGMDIFQAIDVLVKNRISGAPVVDDGHNLIGVLSEKDCLRVFANNAFYHLDAGLVEDFMSREVCTVDPDDDIFKVADMFLKNNFRRLPVLAAGRLVGQVSRRDVLNMSRKMVEEPPVPKEWTDAKYLTPEIKAALADRQSEG